MASVKISSNGTGFMQPKMILSEEYSSAPHSKIALINPLWTNKRVSGLVPLETLASILSTLIDDEVFEPRDQCDLVK